MTTLRDATVFIRNSYCARKAPNSKGTLDSDAVSLPGGWELLDVIDETHKDGDYAAIFINKQSREIFIAGRGTATWHDTKTFPGIAVLVPPEKRVESAERILAQLRRDYPQYRIDAGGHSLGGLVWAKVSARDSIDSPIHVVLLNAPSTGWDQRDLNHYHHVVAISENMDWVGNYGPRYPNMVKLDIVFGPWNQFGEKGTHSVSHLLIEGIDKSPNLAAQVIGSVDLVALFADDLMSHINWHGGGHDGGPNSHIHTKTFTQIDGSIRIVQTNTVNDQVIYEGVLGHPFPTRTEKVRKVDGLTYSSTTLFDQSGHIRSVENRVSNTEASNLHTTCTELLYNAQGRISGVTGARTSGTNEPTSHRFLFDNNKGEAAWDTEPDNRSGKDAFYVSSTMNSFETISIVTGVSVDILSGLNPGLTGKLDIGTLIRLPDPDNSRTPTIEVWPELAPLAPVKDPMLEGYTERSTSHSVKLGEDTLFKTDFVTSQQATFTTGGVRPYAAQPDPNAKPNDWLAKNFVSYDATSHLFNTPQQPLNAAALGSISAGSTKQAYVDPVLLDLSGEGVRMTDYRNAGVLFDIEHSGALQRTGWADTRTGILVNPAGKAEITNISQLFSEYYGGVMGQNGRPGTTPYKDGFAALQAQDSQRDEVIDAKDSIWPELRVWVDANHNGKSEADELKTPASLGITAFGLTYCAARPGEIRDGNHVRAYGHFTLNGKRREMLSVKFIADPVRINIDELAEGNILTATVGAKFLPGGFEIPTRADGDSIHPGMFKTYVSHSDENQVLNATALGAHNLYAGAGNDTLIAAAEGGWLVGGGGSNTYRGGPGNDVFVISAADDPRNIHGGGGTDTVIVVGKQSVMLNMAQAEVHIAEGGEGDDVIFSGGRTGVYIKGGSGDCTLIGGAGDDVIVGGPGRNLIIGGSGKALIYAGPRGDTIYGPYGDSIINAGGGNDRIFAGPGNDLIKVGCGNARIDGGEGINIVQLHGSYGDYNIEGTAFGYVVRDKIPARDGTVTLKNIQRLNFKDADNVGIDIFSPAPVADNLYQDKDGEKLTREKVHVIAAAQLLANDQLFNGRLPLRVVSAHDAVGGSAVLLPSGDIAFSPDPGSYNIMQFKYSLVDALGNSATVIDVASKKTVSMQALVSLHAPDMPTDPLLHQQWYLHDVNVLPVWQDYTGKGVRIGQFEFASKFAVGPELLDDNHPDLLPNIDPIWLAMLSPEERAAHGMSNHATSVAGVMVAAKNGYGIVGVAHGATLGSHCLVNLGRRFLGLGNMQKFDIASHSWSLTGGFDYSNLPRGYLGQDYVAQDYAANKKGFDGWLTLLSHAHYAAKYGRGGLGTVIVISAGNDAGQGGTAQNLFSNSRFAVQVAAINVTPDLSILNVQRPIFSSPGASILVAAPGSKITTTSQKFVTDQGSIFGADFDITEGTSLATPIVSGIVALMLEANPNLGYRDVQKILALSAKQVNAATTPWAKNGAKNWNGGAMHVSHYYGFGKVDARAAVRLAETWTVQSTSENGRIGGIVGLVVEAIQPENRIVSTLNISDDSFLLEHIEVDLDISVGRLGDWVVKLVSPAGTQSLLLNREGTIPEGFSGAAESDRGSTWSGNLKYTFMTTHCLYEKIQGNWRLELIDAGKGRLPVSLNRWELRFHGSKAGADDTYIYTDEYKTLALIDPARKILDDAVNGVAGGRNAINTAAMTGNMFLDLTTGLAFLADIPLTIRNPHTIQNLLSGDGNDILAANHAGCVLDGGRGNNILRGGDGKDIFVIHKRSTGWDSLSLFDPQQDRIILVGFDGISKADLVISQQDSEVRIYPGTGQFIVLKEQQIANLDREGIFTFQNTLLLPLSYVDSSNPDNTLLPEQGQVKLTGGGGELSMGLLPNGLWQWNWQGKIYQHDALTSGQFVVMPQAGQSDYHNILLGFRHARDKIDLRPLNITHFDDLLLEKLTPVSFFDAPIVEGVGVRSKALGTQGQPAKILYLDAVDLPQVTESDFIFAHSDVSASKQSWQSHVECLSNNLVSMQAMGTAGGNIIPEQKDQVAIDACLSRACFKEEALIV